MPASNAGLGNLGELNFRGFSLPLLCPKHVAADVRVEKLTHGQKDLDLLLETPNLMGQKRRRPRWSPTPGGYLLGEGGTWKRIWPMKAPRPINKAVFQVAS